MQLHNDLGSGNIKDVIAAHPRIGTILDRYDIGCTKCTVGTCLLQDVVTVHFLDDAVERQIEEEINAYLASIDGGGEECE